jgi:hypothetical protein
MHGPGTRAVATAQAGAARSPNHGASVPLWQAGRRCDSGAAASSSGLHWPPQFSLAESYWPGTPSPRPGTLSHLSGRVRDSDSRPLPRSTTLPRTLSSKILVFFKLIQVQVLNTKSTFLASHAHSPLVLPSTLPPAPPPHPSRPRPSPSPLPFSLSPTSLAYLHSLNVCPNPSTCVHCCSWRTADTGYYASSLGAD